MISIGPYEVAYDLLGKRKDIYDTTFDSQRRVYLQRGAFSIASIWRWQDCPLLYSTGSPNHEYPMEDLSTTDITYHISYRHEAIATFKMSRANSCFTICLGQKILLERSILLRETTRNSTPRPILASLRTLPDTKIYRI